MKLFWKSKEKKTEVTSDSAAIKNDQYGVVVLHTPKVSHKVDLVFVHGLTGGCESTWRKGDVLWPKELLPKSLPEARILTFGYDADIVNFWSAASQNRIGNHAQSLVTSLADIREETETVDKPIILVAHSLGGLVSEDALLASKNSAEPYLRSIVANTRGIIFLGTPHCGSDLANWAHIASSFVSVFKATNRPALSVLRADSEVLARIQKEFHTMLRSQKEESKPDVMIVCFYEELPLQAIKKLVVPMHSAILPSYESRSIRANHTDLTRFAALHEAGYQSICAVLRRWARTLGESHCVAQDSPDKSRDVFKGFPGPAAEGSTNFVGTNIVESGTVLQGTYAAGGNMTIS